MLLARVTVECFWKMLLVGHVTEQCNTLFTHCYFAMFSLSIHQMQITCTHIFYHSIKMHTSPAQHPHFTRDLRNWRTFCARVARGFTTLACCRHEFRAGQDTGKKIQHVLQFGAIDRHLVSEGWFWHIQMTFHGFTRSKHVPCQRVAWDTLFLLQFGKIDESRSRGLPATPQKVHSTKKNARIDPHCAAAFQEGFYTACTHLHLQSCRCLVQLHFLDLQLDTGTKKVAGILCNCIFTSACLRL